MTDEVKEADLRAGDPQAEIVAERSPDTTETAAAGEAPIERAGRGRETVSRGGLSAHTRSRLAAQLRTMYDAVAQQPVPDRFADLIAQLDGGVAKKG